MKNNEVKAKNITELVEEFSKNAEKLSGTCTDLLLIIERLILLIIVSSGAIIAGIFIALMILGKWYDYIK